jgi:hypothetical protein
MSLTPLKSAENCFLRSRRLLALANVSPAPVPKFPANDLRRASLVMAVAGLDTYLHARVLRSAARLRKASQFPSAWRAFDIPLIELAKGARATVVARAAGKDSRPWVHLLNALQERILKDPFQSPKQVELAVSLCGKNKIWQKVAPIMASTPEVIKKRLGEIAHRRNQIVHEGDLTRRVRPQKLKWNKMRTAWCQSQTDWLESLVRALDQALA